MLLAAAAADKGVKWWEEVRLGSKFIADSF
jgi:hypothetical protein